ncbi:MAG: FAD-dependent monooxygenase [Anaerolineae bacterium]
MIVIIGASSAGLFLAYLLAKEGLPVRVFEQRDMLNLSSRTLIVTSKICDVLGFVPSEGIINKIEKVELFSPNKGAEVKLASPDLVLERRELIRLLARKAKQEGAEIKFGYKFLGFEEGQDGLIVELENLKNGKMQYSRTTTLIGADGASSRVAEVADMNSVNTVTILQAKVAVPPGTRKDAIKVWFNKEETDFFYWLIPESEGRAVLGLISENPRKAKAGLSSFLDSLEFEVQSFQEGKTPLYDPHLEVSRKNSKADIFLVGDAAAQVKDSTVGGVVAGLRGATALARAVAQEGKYEKELIGLQRELGLHSRMRGILNRFSDSDYDHLLGLLNGRTKKVLGIHNRDELSKAFFKLIITQPKFLVFASRFLF